MATLDEREFQKKSDAALEELKRRMLDAGDEHGFDVEGQSGKLEVIFARSGFPHFRQASN